MTALKTAFQRVATAAAAATLCFGAILPQNSAADTLSLLSDLEVLEGRSVAPPFLGGAQSADLGGVLSDIVIAESLLDFPDTGYTGVAAFEGKGSVTDILVRALTAKATILGRACEIVDTATMSGRVSLSKIGARVAAIKVALQYIPATTPTYSGRASYSKAEEALSDTAEMMDILGGESVTVESELTSKGSVTDIHLIVEDMYNRAAYVCANYAM